MASRPSRTQPKMTASTQGLKSGRRPGACLDVRLSAAARKKIERAASRLGQSASDFAAATLLERAETVLNSEHVTVLNPPQWERFLATLAHPPAPNEVLQRLMHAGARYSSTDANGVTHFDSRFDEDLTAMGTMDPH